MTNKINSLSNRDEFVNFLREQSENFVLHKHKEEWENTNVSDYLESIASWIEDFSECPANDINWENIDYPIIGRLFYMGKIYE